MFPLTGDAKSTNDRYSPKADILRSIGPTGSIDRTEMLVMADFKARWMK